MLRQFFVSALLAGLLTGFVVTGLQEATTTPLIFEAETFESAEVPSATGPSDTHVQAPGDHSHGVVATDGHAHSHGEDGGWAPADGMERLFFTSLANMIAGIGFGFLLVACLAFWNGKATGQSGLLWGMAGFTVFTLAPALGLPPELPATNAGDLVARQTWWIGTAAATALGLWLMVFAKKAWAHAAGIVALALPHIIGAPHPDALSTLVPAELSAQFTAASIATSAVFWACLGWLAGTLFGHPALAGKTGHAVRHAI